MLTTSFTSISIHKKLVAIACMMAMLAPVFAPITAIADEEEEIEELEDQINEQRDRVQQLDAEIAEQQRKLGEVTSQKKTLETEVRTLDASKAKIETSIKKTQTNIVTSELTIEKLAIEINRHEQAIVRNSSAVAETIRDMSRRDDTSLIETYLSEGTFSEAVNAMEANRRVRDAVRAKSEELRQLKIELADKMNLPKEGTAVLSWPLDRIVVTQQFGSSEFAQKNPSVYGGRASHPGVDFGASIGTPAKATLSGTVTNTGNTDAIPGCYSWGKWVLIKHDNGLTSLYAHLSVIGVDPGDRVATGDIIGNTGNTGYSTGPHLHYTLYASEGVQVVPFTNVRSTTSCAGAVTPTAPPDAYLDPMDYLPK
jgi:murein DD-endopeptidase MepM/ murein hydrolase activator NlpD